MIDDFIEDVSITELNGTGSTDSILTGTQYAHRFKGYSELENIGAASYLRKNPVESILDGDNSFLNIWGGELLRDNYNIYINAGIGEDRGYTILHGKNLQQLIFKYFNSIIIKVLLSTNYIMRCSQVQLG